MWGATIKATPGLLQLHPWWHEAGLSWGDHQNRAPRSPERLRFARVEQRLEKCEQAIDSLFVVDHPFCRKTRTEEESTRNALIPRTRWNAW